MFRRTAAVACITTAGILAVPGHAGASGSAPGISDTCANPTVIQEGFLAARTTFFRARVQPKPGEPSTLWVCYRAKVGSVDSAGRIDVNGFAVISGLPWIDSASRDCAEAPANDLPGPHPIEDGAIGPVGFYLDTFSAAGQVWVCMEAGTVKERVVVPLPGNSGPVVDATTDSGPAAPQPTMTPQPGLPSSSCYAGAHGTPTELVNTDHGPVHLFVFSAVEPVPGEAHLCARVHGGPHPAGIDLGVNADPGDIVRVTSSPDVSPCTTNVVTLSTPPVSIKVTPTGVPPSICVAAPGVPPTRYTVVTLSGPPPVSVTLDP
jgi:hypothetical protein